MYLIRFFLLLVFVSCDNVDFLYHPNAKLGPKKWHKVNVKPSEYWKYFKDNCKKNSCKSSGGPGGQSSPINVLKQKACFDDHPIHTKVGFFSNNYCAHLFG